MRYRTKLLDTQCYRIMLIIVILIALLYQCQLTVVLPASADTTSLQQFQEQLVVVDDDKEHTMSKRSSFDFGPVMAGEKEDILHSFTLKNISQNPVTIDHIQPSCHCTSVQIIEAAKTPYAVFPGQVIHVIVKVKLGLAPRVVNEAAFIYLVGRTDPEVFLEMNGIVTPRYLITPPSFSLGRVYPGERRIFWINLSRQVEQRTPVAVPTFQSSSPDISLLAASVYRSDHQLHNIDTGHKQALESFDYKVVCQPLEKQGAFYGTITFYLVTHQKDNVWRRSSLGSIPITGTIVSKEGQP